MVDSDSELALLARPDDTADEIYITYGKGGERVLTTTGQKVWSETYQRSGGKKWDALGALAGDYRGPGSLGADGERIARAARRIRPRWATETIEFDPAIYAPRHGDNAGQGPNGGARAHSQERGASPTRALDESWDNIDGGGLSKRTRIRSHRHCPGCNGHSRNNRGFANLFGRFLIAFIIGYAGISWLTNFGVHPLKYALGVLCALYAAHWFRPVWNELGIGQENGGRPGGRR